MDLYGSDEYVTGSVDRMCFDCGRRLPETFIAKCAFAGNISFTSLVIFNVNVDGNRLIAFIVHLTARGEKGAG